MHGTNLMLLYYSPPEGPPMKEPRIPPSWQQLIGKQLTEPAAPMLLVILQKQENIHEICARPNKTYGEAKCNYMIRFQP